MTSALGASGSERDTITTGRVFPAKSRSARHTSPGRGCIQNIQNFLPAPAGAQNIKRVLIRQSDNLGHSFANLVGGLRFPLMKSGVQRFPATLSMAT